MLTNWIRRWGIVRGLVVTLSLALVSVSGCGLVSGVGGIKAPPAEAAQKVTASSNALTFDLLGGLSQRADGKNVVISPLSVSSLLAMLVAGANGDTADAIAGVMHLQGSSPEDAANFGRLLQYLAQSSHDVDLTIANAVWANTGFTLNKDFVANLKDNFNADVDELDLGSQQGADTVDSWVSDATRGLIKKMSDALHLPDPQAVVVLMNAVYFKGSWTSPFEKEQTRPGDFTRLDGSTVEVPMMSQTHEFQVAKGDGFTLIRLPYGKSGRFAMDIFVPGAQQDPVSFAENFNEETWTTAIASLKEQRVYLRLPRFELEYKATTELDDLLKELGMEIAYSPQADFSRMSPSSPWLSRIAHKTYIRVDEEGTEAAGVTGGVMVESMPPQIEVDHPFVFTITDTETKTILFAGFVADPAVK